MAQTQPPADRKVLVITAREFVPWIAGDRLVGDHWEDHYLSPEIQAGGSDFLAPIHLPDGAVITHLELDACVEDRTRHNIVALIEEACDPDVPCHSDTMGLAIAAGEGCLKTFGGQSWPPVDNRRKIYRIGVTFHKISSAEPAGLKAVRIYYAMNPPPAPATPTFSDVPTTHPFYRWVEAMAAAGFTAGCGDGKFCPDAPVTRGQMSVFISKAADLYIPQQ